MTRLMEYRQCQRCHREIAGKATKYCSPNCGQRARRDDAKKRLRAKVAGPVQYGLPPDPGCAERQITARMQDALAFWACHTGAAVVWQEPCGTATETGLVVRVRDKSVWVDYGRGPERTNPLQLRLAKEQQVVGPPR